MKRFTETNKWRDQWFRKLSIEHKVFWSYICDNCDNAGVFDPDLDLASFSIGATLDAKDLLRAFEGRIKVLPNGKWFVVKFVEFQWGTLNPANACHRGVKALLDKISDENSKGPSVALQRATGIGIGIGIGIGEGKGSKSPELTLDCPPNEPLESKWTPDGYQKRLNAFFHRRDTTAWSESEIKAYRKLTITPDEFAILEKYYLGNHPNGHDYRRRDLQTLLNNYQGEVDRARNWKTPTPTLY